MSEQAAAPTTDDVSKIAERLLSILETEFEVLRTGRVDELADLANQKLELLSRLDLNNGAEASEPLTRLLLQLRTANQRNASLLQARRRYAERAIAVMHGAPATPVYAAQGTTQSQLHPRSIGEA